MIEASDSAPARRSSGNSDSPIGLDDRNHFPGVLRLRPNRISPVISKKHKRRTGCHREIAPDQDARCPATASIRVLPGGTPRITASLISRRRSSSADIRSASESATSTLRRPGTLAAPPHPWPGSAEQARCHSKGDTVCASVRAVAVAEIREARQGLPDLGGATLRTGVGQPKAGVLRVEAS